MNSIEKQLLERDVKIQMLSHMLRVSLNDDDISRVFNEQGYKKIAVYGYDVVSELFVDLLVCKGIKIECVIDRAIKHRIDDIPLLRPTRNLPKLDVIIVTNVAYYERIRADLLKLEVNAHIVSLEEIIYQL